MRASTSYSGGVATTPCAAARATTRCSATPATTRWWAARAWTRCSATPATTYCEHATAAPTGGSTAATARTPCSPTRPTRRCRAARRSAPAEPPARIGSPSRRRARSEDTEMLGHHPLLERRLRSKGRRAVAQILEAKRTSYTETLGNDAIVSDTRRLWKLRLRVAAEGESPFEVDIDELFVQTHSPSIGSRLPVLYDPDDHGHVVIDHTEEGDRLFREEMDRERVEERVAGMRERGQGDLAESYVEAHQAARKMFEDLPSDPTERRRVLRERKAAIAATMGGATVMVGGQPIQPAPPSGPAAAAATADALTKLADLHDRGVITDEELQAQKAKLLGG